MKESATTRQLGIDGFSEPSPHRELPLSRLTWRHRLIVRLMTVGSSDPGLLTFVRRAEKVKVGEKWIERELPPPACGEPLTVLEAGRLLGFRVPYSRALLDKPPFIAALAQARGDHQ